MTEARYKVEQRHPHVLIVSMETKNPCNFEQQFLLSSDRHHDNTHCNHELELKHLKQAQQRNAGIFDFGDLFCSMQGKWDRRADQSQLREELRGNNYLDQLVKYNSDFYRPFAKNFVMVTPGNHETAILKHHQTNLSERFVERMNTEAATNVKLGTYSGFVIFRFKAHTQSMTVVMAHHHGYGGGGPVTRGTIQSNRQAVYLPDAQIVVSGHVHEEWMLTIPRSRVNSQGTTYIDEQIHIKIAGYKEEYACHEGYHIEGGRPPKPNGAAWLTFRMERDSKGDKYKVVPEVTRAK